MEYVINNIENVKQLRNGELKNLIRRIKLGDSVSNQLLEKKLNKYYFACGCQTGSVFVLCTMFTSLALGLAIGFQGSLLWWRVLIYIAIAAIVGKGIGLLWSYVQLKRVYELLQIQLK